MEVRGWSHLIFTFWGVIFTPGRPVTGNEKGLVTLQPASVLAVIVRLLFPTRKLSDEIIAMGATSEDVIAGIEWLKGQGKPIKYYSSIVGPARTAMQKRVQGNGNGNGQKRAYKDANGETVYL